MTRRKLRMAAALGVLALLGAGLLAAQAIARTRSSGEAQEGEVVVNGAVVMRIRSAAGGYTATQRADQIAQRLNKAFGEGLTWGDFRVGRDNGETAVVTTRGDLIATADRFHAQANGTTPTLLARAWDTNLVQALGGQAPAAPIADAGPAPPSGTPRVGWEAQDKKDVPVFSIGTPGVSIGGARVSGPKSQVAQVKAVAQIEGEWKDVLRARIYVPVSSISTKPERVQGVSVSALIDYNLPL